jgi:hypothetical protein
MVDTFWMFLKDPANQALLGWICGGIAAVAGGAWAVVKFYSKKPEDAQPRVHAAERGVAIGRDNTNSAINIGPRSVEKR